MHELPVAYQVVQYNVPPCAWAPAPLDLHRSSASVPHPSVKKYVIWCLICGGVSCLLGVMFLGVYFLLRSYTSTVGYFETVPTFVPATLLMLTGLCIISLERRRKCYSYLIKLSGACGLASALTCGLIAVTTTLLHMSSLQELGECEYTQKTRTCTCYSVTTESQTQGVNDSKRFVFGATTDCSLVDGGLYACLKTIFGLSVAGIFVAIFSCMLAYQLFSHERRMMSTTMGQLDGTLSIDQCRCCEQCQVHREWTPHDDMGKTHHPFGPPPPYSELFIPTNFEPQYQHPVFDQENVLNCYQTDFDPNCKQCNINLYKG